MPKASGLALASVGALGVGLAAYGALIERENFMLRHETLPVLDPGSDPIRVLHLSDIHMAPWHGSTVAWIRELVELDPDVVVGTGDFLGHPEGLPALSEALAPLRGVPGVVVHGSNDRLTPRFKNPFLYLLRASQPEHTAEGAPMDFEGLVALYEQLGWTDINNAVTQMELCGSLLEWVGVGDAHYGLDDLSTLPALLDEAREQETSDSPHSSVTTLGVTHAPYTRVLNALTTHGAEAIFAGHTHGGQVCLPGGLALTTNCDLPRSMASGVHIWNHASKASYLQVSKGLGTSIYAPVRLFCAPEAVLITLVAEDIGYS
jgi:predicted MPP superfamily phosphohydrolase